MKKILVMLCTLFIVVFLLFSITYAYNGGAWIYKGYLYPSIPTAGVGSSSEKIVAGYFTYLGTENTSNSETFETLNLIINGTCVGCGMEDGDINTFAKLQAWVTDETLLKAGTLTNAKVCKYDSAGTDIVCNYDDDDVPEAGDFGGLTAGDNLTFSPAGTINVDDPFTITTLTTEHTSMSEDATINGEPLVAWNGDCWNIASVSDTDDDLPLYTFYRAATVTNVGCRSTGGTSTVVTLGDGSNSFEAITCATTWTADDGSITNASFTALEQLQFDIGTITGDVRVLQICAKWSWD